MHGCLEGAHPRKGPPTLGSLPRQSRGTQELQEFLQEPLRPLPPPLPAPQPGLHAAAEHIWEPRQQGKPAANSWMGIKMPPWSAPRGLAVQNANKTPNRCVCCSSQTKHSPGRDCSFPSKHSSAPWWLFPIKSGWFCPEEPTEIPAQLKEREDSPASPDLQRWRGCSDANWQRAGREQNIPKKAPHFPHPKEPGEGGGAQTFALNWDERERKLCDSRRRIFLR